MRTGAAVDLGSCVVHGHAANARREVVARVPSAVPVPTITIVGHANTCCPRHKRESALPKDGGCVAAGIKLRAQSVLLESEFQAS